MTSAHRTRRQPFHRSRIGAALLAASALVAGACAAAATPVPTAGPTAGGSPVAGATVKTAQHSLGTYLTGPDGKALYLFTNDSKDTSTCTGSCAANWPALTATGGAAPMGDTGVTGTLATITRADGGVQVTYNGVPLYYFAKDTKAGDTGGQGVNNVWYLAGTSASATSGAITGGLGQGGATAAPGATAGGSANAVQIRNSTFPATTTVVAGTTVKWTNGDGEDHTVTADDNSFDSGNIKPGASFERTFSSAATIKYHCNIHPEMTGTVSVSSGSIITY